MLKALVAIPFLAAMGCATTSGDGVRYLHARTPAEAVRMHTELAGCRLIEKAVGVGEDIYDDGEFRKKALLYAADTLLLVTNNSLGPTNSQIPTTSVGEGYPPSRAVTPMWAYYYRCGAKP